MKFEHRWRTHGRSRLTRFPARGESGNHKSTHRGADLDKSRTTSSHRARRDQIERPTSRNASKETQPVWQSTTAEEKNCEMWFVQAILQLEQEAQDALQAGHLAVKALRKLPDPNPDLTSAEKLDRAERCVPGFKCGPGYYSDVKVWRRERDSQKAHADATEA